MGRVPGVAAFGPEVVRPLESVSAPDIEAVTWVGPGGAGGRSGVAKATAFGVDGAPGAVVP